MSSVIRYVLSSEKDVEEIIHKFISSNKNRMEKKELINHALRQLLPILDDHLKIEVMAVGARFPGLRRDIAKILSKLLHMDDNDDDNDNDNDDIKKIGIKTFSRLIELSPSVDSIITFFHMFPELSEDRKQLLRYLFSLRPSIDRYWYNVICGLMRIPKFYISLYTAMVDGIDLDESLKAKRERFLLLESFIEIGIYYNIQNLLEALSRINECAQIVPEHLLSSSLHRPSPNIEEEEEEDLDQP